jgi:hypothetical protein
MQTENKIFDVIDFVLKKTNVDISSFEFKNYYVLNRWLSMSDQSMAKIVNATTNRWILKNNTINILKFYRYFLPKTSKRIKYIKKTSKLKNEDQKDFVTLARNFELSTREIEMYENTIDFLNQTSN